MKFILTDMYRHIESEYEIKDGTTLKDLLDQLDYSKYEGFCIVNGKHKPHSYFLQEGDKIYLVPALQGG